MIPRMALGAVRAGWREQADTAIQIFKRYVHYAREFAACEFAGTAVAKACRARSRSVAARGLLDRRVRPFCRSERRARVPS